MIVDSWGLPLPGHGEKADSGGYISVSRDRVVDQGQRPPFDPRLAVERFAKVLKEYGVSLVSGDRFAGKTFAADFERHDVRYQVSELSKSQIYEALEPRLNSGRVVLLDDSTTETQLLGLVWRGRKIDHLSGEHDDHSNAAAGTIHVAAEGVADFSIEAFGERAVPDW